MMTIQRVSEPLSILAAGEEAADAQPLLLSQIQVGQVLALKIENQSALYQDEPTRLFQVIKNPLFEQSARSFQRERMNETSMLTFYARQNETQQLFLIGAKCCDLTTVVSIKSAYRLLVNL
jgi:hypothetical protein